MTAKLTTLSRIKSKARIESAYIAPEIWGQSPIKNGGNGSGEGARWLGEPLPRKFLKNRTWNYSFWCIFEANVWNKQKHAWFENMFNCPHSWATISNIWFLEIDKLFNFAEQCKIVGGLRTKSSRSGSLLDDKVEIQAFLVHIIWSQNI